MAKIDLFDLFCKISIDLTDFEKGIEQAKSKASTFAKDLSGVSSSIDKAYSGVKDVLKPAVDGFKAVEGVGKKAGNAITTGLKGFTAAATAVGGFGAAAVKSGMTFDATMSEVSAISGATGQDFQDLRDKALEMGAKTKFSASEAAEAMTYMGMAGWKTEDMLGGIAGIMNLAAASGEDLATTSDIVTNALTAFGLQASDSAHFADIMATAASSANTDVSMMGESFKYAAPVMGTLGYSAEDTAVALGLMGNAGIQASMAGTSLKTAMLNMASPTKNMAGVMSQYGISLTDANGEMYSLGEVMSQLRDKMGGLDETTKAAAASTLFGKEAAAGMLAIINAAPEDFDKLTAAIDNCNGSAERMSAIMMDNLAGDVQYFKSALESLQIAISDSLTPTLREFAQFGQKAMANLLEGFQGGGVSGFMSALSGIVTDGVTMLAQKAPEFASVSLQFVQALADGLLAARSEIVIAASTVLFNLIDGVRAWLSTNSGELIAAGNQIIAVLFSAFLNAGSLISDNIGQFIPLIARAFIDYHDALFLVGIDILGAIAQGIVDNQEGIQNMASQAIEEMVFALQENAPMIIEGGLALLEALVGAIEENLPLIVETGAEIIGQLVAGIATAGPEVQAIIGVAVLPHILKIVDTVSQISGAVGQVVEFVTGASGIKKVLDIGKTLMSGISKLFALIAANPVVAIVTGIIAAVVLLYTKCEWFRDAVHAVIDAVAGFFQGAWDLIKSVWENAGEFFGGIVDGIKGVFDGIGEFLGGLFTTAWELVQGAWDAAIEFFAGIGDGIHEAFEAVTSFLGEAFSAAWDDVKGAWDAAIGFFSDIWNSIKTASGETADKIGTALSNAWDAVASAWDGAMEFFSGIWENIKGVFGNAWDTFKEIGGNILEGLWNGIGDKVEWLKSKVKGVVNTIKSWFTGKDGFDEHSPSKWSKQVFRYVMDGGVQGLDDGTNRMMREVNSITDQIKNGLNFGTASVGLVANGVGYSAPRSVQNAPQAGFGGAGNTYVTINSPVAVDAVTAAREWKKTAQRMAMGYV